MNNYKVLLDRPFCNLIKKSTLVFNIVIGLAWLLLWISPIAAAVGFLKVDQGDNQIVKLGDKPAPVVFTVYDDANKPILGKNVQLFVNPSTTSLTVSQAITDNAGQVTTQLSAPTDSGIYTITAVSETGIQTAKATINVYPPLGFGSSFSLTRDNVIVTPTIQRAEFLGGTFVSHFYKSSVYIADTVRVGGAFKVATEHVGKKGDILVILCRFNGQNNCDLPKNFFVSNLPTSAKTEYFSLGVDDTEPTIWTGDLRDLQPALKDATFPRDFIALDVVLKFPTVDKWQIAFGYRVIEPDGSITHLFNQPPIPITVQSLDAYPVLGAGSSITLDAQGKQVGVTPIVADSDFRSGVTVNNLIVPVRTVEATTRDLVKIVGAFNVPPEHIGRSAQILVLACQSPKGRVCKIPRENSTRSLRAAGGDDKYYQIVQGDERPQPWSGDLHDLPAASDNNINLLQTNSLQEDYTVKFPESGDVQIRVGYQLPQEEGSSTTVLSQPVQATITLPKYSLMIRKEGNGTVQVNGQIVDCSIPNQCLYDGGSTLLLIASPGENFTFLGWNGDCTTTTETSCQVSFNNDTQLTATFDITLPNLGMGSGLDKSGNPRQSTTQFANGISVNNAVSVQTTEVKLSQTVKIMGRIKVDPTDINQTVDILVIAGYKPAKDSDPETFFMLNGDSVEVWDLNRPFANALAALKARTSTTLKSNYQNLMYQGKFLATGRLRVFFGYRLSNGTIVYSPQTVNIVITAD